MAKEKTRTPQLRFYTKALSSMIKTGPSNPDRSALTIKSQAAHVRWCQAMSA